MFWHIWLKVQAYFAIKSIPKLESPPTFRLNLGKTLIDSGKLQFSSEKQRKVFYSIKQTMNRNTRRKKIQWLNVQNAELKYQSQRRPGKWLGDQTNKENECN